MKKIISICLILCILFGANAFALQGVPKYVKDIKSFSAWVEYNVKYLSEIGGEYWQCPRETIERKGGDCEDLAILFSAYLSEQEIRNWIIIIEYKGLKVAHAICAWQVKPGAWYISSNTKTYYIPNKTLRASILYLYPDANSAWILAHKETWYKKVPRPQEYKKRVYPFNLEW